MRRNSRGLLESSFQWKSVLEIKNGPGWEWNFDDCHIIFRSSLVFYWQLPNPTTGSREAFRKAPREVDNNPFYVPHFLIGCARRETGSPFLKARTGVQLPGLELQPPVWSRLAGLCPCHQNQLP